MEKFQKAPFEEIAAHCESKVPEEDAKADRTVFKTGFLLRLTCYMTAWLRSLSSPSGQVICTWLTSKLLLLANGCCPPAGPLPARPGWFPCQRATPSISLCPSTR